MFKRAIRNIRSQARAISESDIPVTVLALSTGLPLIPLFMLVLSH